MYWWVLCAARSSWIFAGSTAFYYIPAERLQDSSFPIRYVALYQSQYVFGAQAGVRYYGEVTKCSAVRRSAITEIDPRRGTEENLYYRFDIRKWKQLNRPIEAKETGFVRDFTNLFLLEHSIRTPELWLRTEEEYRLCSALKRAVWGDTINEPDNGLAFEIPGLHRKLCGGEKFSFQTKAALLRGMRSRIFCRIPALWSGASEENASRGIP